MARKYVTIGKDHQIDVTGFNQKQIDRIVAMGGDGKNGQGKKAAALAKEIDARNKSETKDVKEEKKAGKKPVDLGVNEDGTIDAGKATKAVTDTANADITKTFNMQNPSEQTDAFGNTRTVTRNPKTGETKITDSAGGSLQATLDQFIAALGNYSKQGPLDLSGAPKILQTGDVQDEFTSAADANYNYITKDYEQQKQREMESARQELANRGIPLGSKLYDKTLNDINTKYQGMYDQAKNQGIMAGNQTLSTITGIQSGARDSYVDSQTKMHNSGLSDAAALSGIASGFKQTATPYAGGQSNLSPQLQALLGQISEADLKKLTIELSKRNSGGGGGSSSTGGFAIGNAPDLEG